METWTKSTRVDPQFSWRWSKEMREILKEKDSPGKSEWELKPVYKFEPHPNFQPHGTSYLFATSDGTDRLDATQCSQRKPALPVLGLGYVAVVKLDGKLSHEDYRSSRYANDGCMEERFQDQWGWIRIRKPA